jgi:hypothetical protein
MLALSSTACGGLAGTDSRDVEHETKHDQVRLHIQPVELQKLQFLISRKPGMPALMTSDTGRWTTERLIQAAQ